VPRFFAAHADWPETCTRALGAALPFALSTVMRVTDVQFAKPPEKSSAKIASPGGGGGGGGGGGAELFSIRT
jgi:hypothetical protein